MRAFTFCRYFPSESEGICLLQVNTLRRRKFQYIFQTKFFPLKSAFRCPHLTTVYTKDFLVTICFFYDLVYLECLSFHVFYWKTKKLLDILSFGVGRHNLLVSVLRHSAILLGDEKQRKRFWQWGEKNMKYHLLFCDSKFFRRIFLNVFFYCTKLSVNAHCKVGNPLETQLKRFMAKLKI